MLVTPAEKKAVAAIESLIEKSIDWQGAAPASSDASAKDGAEDKPKERKGRNRKPKKAEAKSSDEDTKSESKQTEDKQPNDKKSDDRQRGKKGRKSSVYDDVGTVADSAGFHDGNMPSFLAKPLLPEESPSEETSSE